MVQMDQLTDFIKNHDEDFVNLLINSLIIEEKSIAKILEGEGKLINLFVKELNNKNNVATQDILNVNRSITDSLRTILEKEKLMNEKLIKLMRIHEDHKVNLSMRSKKKT
ncbi:MAG: hypothetical protein GX490_01590 [Bacilli bacterium]|nr:hypothetical protein [Bacilli bacterium]